MTGEFSSLVDSWRRDLRARNLAPKTIKTYGESADQLSVWLEDEHQVAEPGDVERDHIRGFISHLLDTKSPATASVRFRALQQLFNWLVDEGEIDTSPMDRMKPPTIPEQTTPVLTPDNARALLRKCSGRGYVDVRDTAVIRLFLDTGMRLDELSSLKVEDVDLDQNVAYVVGKGRRPRACPFGNKTPQALDRYIRQRNRQKRSDLPHLWLGVNGRPGMTDNGIGQMIRKRGADAGIPDLHPHMFRHTFAHEWRLAGGDDDSLMRLVGWKSRQMLHRYGASAADARAREAHKRLMLGDRI
ncbi:MAG: tyrosine-type recombinase/integrase [Acidimicrobiales bacterium]